MPGKNHLVVIDPQNDFCDLPQTYLPRLAGTAPAAPSLPVYLCGETFTLPHLQSVYEAVVGQPLNKVTFRRKIEELGVLEPVAGAWEEGRANRPAQLYRLKDQYRRTLMTSPRSLNLDPGTS